jgi:hypothetical protein
VGGRGRREEGKDGMARVFLLSSFYREGKEWSPKTTDL